MHSFTSILIHCIWSTKNREPYLSSDLRNRLWPYLGGIARENKMKTIAIGGVVDHVHILVSLPATLSIAKALLLLKGNSSKWCTKRFLKYARLNGRKAMVRSALASPRSMTLSGTSAIRRSTTESDRFARSLWSCSGDTAWITTSGCSIDSFVPAGTRLCTDPTKPSAEALGYFRSCLSALDRVILDDKEADF